MSTPPAKHPIVGRKHELELIGSLITHAARGGALILCGEPGVGKSVLLKAAAAAAARHGVTTLWAAGIEFDASHVSYSGLSQILAPLHGRIATLRDTYRQALTIVLGLGSGATSTSLVVANRRGLPQR